MFLAYLWCRWGAALKGFSPVIELGRTSLFVYWVHIEFVYGRFSILPKRSQTVVYCNGGYCCDLRGDGRARDDAQSHEGPRAASAGVLARARGARSDRRSRLGLFDGVPEFSAVGRHFEDHLAGSRQSHLFASDALDGLGIAAQRFHLGREVGVFLIQPVDLPRNSSICFCVRRMASKPWLPKTS